MASRIDLLAWLLDSDPAIRWQVERDLVNEAPTVWAATRASIATKGFGARLLSLQDRDGQWAGGAFFPAEFDFAAGHQLQSGQAVPLASFPEGDYRLEIKIEDKLAKKTLVRDVNFSVAGS